ncbi:LytR family transcriptional regulator [Streptomyces lavendulae]|uniref:LCP family protein n=1 Tax=Streptomyces sp. NPDC047813 TaxID=3154608 RepID=UPI0011CE04CE|nr:LCP family protein [Streptomyces lavendulae]TXJ74107.1 LytR family transcriptional regulator [Streptomyces lavendulae]
MALNPRTADPEAGAGRHGGGRRKGGSGTGGPDGPGGSTTKRRRRRALRWSATVLAVVILGTAGAGYLYYEHLNANIRKGERSSGDAKAHKTAPNAAGQTPLNILLVGSDSRNSAENLKLGGSKSSVGDPPLGDVQMLIHISADRKSAAMVSIPRDTRVDIPKCTDPDTGKVYPATNDIINTTLGRGGAGCTLATWENLTGVYIDHWMTIDFAGVVKMADAIGGVDVCVKQNVWDRPTAAQRGGSGLKLTAGTHKIKGVQALQWLRTRHAWGSDPLRARAQHMYLNSMLRTLKSQDVFTDTGRLMDLADSATKSLKVSEEIGTVKKLYDLGMEMKSVPSDRITSVTMPNLPDPRDPDNHVVPNTGDAGKLWEMLRDDIPLDKNGGAGDSKQAGDKPRPAKSPSTDPSRLGVLVQNGTGSASEAAVPGRARTIAEALVGRGYGRAAADTAPPPPQDKTVVEYPSADLQGDAQGVAKALGLPATAVKQTTSVSGVTLLLGADWRTGTTFPKQSKPKAGDVPSNADAINGADKGGCMDVYKPYQW